MSPTIYGDPTTSERILIAIHPLFAWLAKRLPDSFGPPDRPAPHPSAMLEEHNWIWRLIFPRFFNRITVDDAAVTELREAASRATLVYVAKGMGQLEVHYFNHLLRRERLPLARYTNALTLRRWMRWDAYWASLAQQEAEIGEGGRPADPLSDNKLSRMIAEGESVLLTLPPSDLADDGIFYTGPVRALVALIEAQRQSPRPIAIVPIDFLWSRRPERATRSIVDILFGEKENPGAIRKIVLFWRNYKEKAQAAIGHPIDCSSFVQWEGGGDAHLAAKLRDELLRALKAKRRTLTGPPLRPRRWFINEVMGDDALDHHLCRIAAELGKPADEVRELAQRYVREIAADLDYTTIELLDRLLSRAFTRIFDSFQVDEAGLARAKELAGEGPVVFVPNHKSHADYLILSHILYHHGMTAPHIAAGINLEFWPLGPIFRRGGAFFIRRAFRDNPLYKAVLETYLKVLLKEGYSQEFFIEGGRSRTGKLLKPKKGMLTMLHSAAAAGGVKNLRFIPVAITYDRVIEQKSYEHELEGGAKQKERTTQVLGLTKFLKRGSYRYGSIYIRFGEPVSAIAGEADAAKIEQLAYRICHQINRRLIATPAAIAACAFLAGARRGVTREEFLRNANVLIAFLKAKGVELSGRIAEEAEAAMDEATALLAQAKLVAPHPEAVVPFFAIDESRRMALAFFKNGIVHFFTTISLIAMLILRRTKAGSPPTAEELAADVEHCRELLTHEFRFATSRTVAEHIALPIAFLVEQGAITRRDDGRLDPVRGREWILELFAAQTMPFVETLAVACRHVAERMPNAAEDRLLVAEMIKSGHDLLLLQAVRYREAITRAGFENALHQLVAARALFMQEPEAGSKRRNLYAPSQDPQAILALKAALEKLL